MLSANTIQPMDIFFYVNIALLFCAIIELTAVIVLRKKTSCAGAMGLTAAIILGVGAAAFFAQLTMYVMRNDNAAYLVYASTAVLYGGFIVSGVYCIMLSRNSHKSMCITAGVLSLIPPVGAFVTVKLSYSIKRDTPVQELVFNGYAFTYAALEECAAKNEAELIDMSGEERLPALDRKQLKAELKKLKQQATTPEGTFRYATAIANYTQNSKKAVKLMSEAALGGYAPALFNLGYYRETGTYVKRDYKKAAEYYSHAAEKGDTDAEMRLCILAIESGDVQKGLDMLRERAEEKSDVVALYNIGVCAEKGIGGDKDIQNALEIYSECAERGMFIAQKRIFALACKNISSASNGDFFRMVTDRLFSDTFAIMIAGLIEIKKRHAADAAHHFLDAVKQLDDWEGFARVLVGTLYLDNGKSYADRVNGTEFIRSAFKLYPNAKNVYAVIPANIRKCVRDDANPKPNTTIS